MIIPAEEIDAEEIFTLHTDSVKKLSSSAYPPEIIDIWQEGRSPSGLKPFITQDYFYIYKDNGVIKGFVHFTEDEIVGLYVKPTEINKGIGRDLFSFAIEKISKRPVKIQSTLNAIEFYERMGCISIGPGVQRRHNRDIYVHNMQYI